MNSEQLRLLTKMKKLIKLGNRRFEIRNDRDYLQDLLEIGISEESAWEHILTLNKNFYFTDEKPYYYQSNNTLVFKKIINGILVYIKLQIIEKDSGDETVCLSFHIDSKIKKGVFV